MNKKQIFALIPARGGSKSIPQKNLLHIQGRSLIARTIEVVKAYDPSIPAYISSDSNDIINDAINNGAICAGPRPSVYAQDASLADDVLLYEWIRSERFSKKIFNCCLYLEPTSPMRTVDDIKACIDLLDYNTNSVFTVSRVSDSMSPHKMFRLNASNNPKPLLDSGNNSEPFPSIRQGLSSSFYMRNGACYAISRAQFMESKRIVCKSSIACIIDTKRVNIDYSEDYFLAQRYINSTDALIP